VNQRERDRGKETEVLKGQHIRNMYSNNYICPAQLSESLPPHPQGQRDHKYIFFQKNIKKTCLIVFMKII
jgi:hypothetical protein